MQHVYYKQSISNLLRIIDKVQESHWHIELYIEWKSYIDIVKKHFNTVKIEEVFTLLTNHQDITFWMNAEELSPVHF